MSSDHSFDSTSMERAELKNLSLEPSKKQAYIELLHKIDMQNVNFCELDFGSAITDKKVRDRAINERIDLIKASHSNKFKFDEHFDEAKKRRAKTMKKSLNMRDDFVKVNQLQTSNWRENDK